jgi:hypothetical protein
LARGSLTNKIEINKVGPIFIDSLDSPPPDSYDIPSLFKPNNTTSTFAVHCKGKHTYCFGTGRESYAKNVILK